MRHMRVPQRAPLARVRHMRVPQRAPLARVRTLVTRWDTDDPLGHRGQREYSFCVPL